MDKQRIKKLESRALVIAMMASLFMGISGAVAAVLSNSTAIMMDGLFSLIGFTAAFIGRRISQKADAGPDRYRPMGYAADEALFTTFRSLSLLGLVMFATAASGMTIYDYMRGAPTPELNFGPLFIYFAVVGLTCFLLWALHRFTWSRTGKVSDILRLEAKAAILDGVLTAAAGLGLGAIYYFGDSILAPIAPIGDSIIVLVLCLAVIGQYRRELLSGMGELVGVTAKPKVIARARRAARASIEGGAGYITDLSVTKLGRNYLVNVYYNPCQPILAKEIDELNLKMIRNVRASVPGADVILMVTEYGRRWPEGINPYDD